MVAFGLADGPVPRELPLGSDLGVSAVGTALLSELAKYGEVPLSERAYQNKSPDSQEALPGSSDEDVLSREERIPKKLSQEMAKAFPGLPQSAKDLLRAKAPLETKIEIFANWLDQREVMKQR